MSDPNIYRRLEALEKWQDAMASVELPRFIGARYTSNAGGALANVTETVINFEDVDYDPLSLVTTGAGWVFTCPLDGHYSVAVFARLEATVNWSPGEIFELNLFRNGVETAMLWRFDSWAAGGVSQSAAGQGETSLYCDVGDTLQVRGYQSSGGGLNMLADSRFNYISITRLG